MDKTQAIHAMSMMNCSVGDNLDIDLSDVKGMLDSETKSTHSLGCWDYYQRYYYPDVIRESYPVYIQERSKDKGKQAFEIIKMLKDGKFVNLRTVGNFIDLMDKLIKIL